MEKSPSTSRRPSPYRRHPWLRVLCNEALQRYGIHQARLRFLSESCFLVIRVDTPDQRYILRIAPEVPTDTMWMMHETEHCWLTALRHDTNLSVPEPIQAQDGTYIQNVPTNQMPEGRIVTLLRWIPGRPVGNRVTASILHQLGACMAQLHRHTEQFVFPPPLSRPHTKWNKLRAWQDSGYDTTALITPAQRELCAEAAQQLLTEITQLGTTSAYGLIHADLTFKNCILDHGELSLIDFAECRYASHFYDMAVPLAELHDPRTIDALRATFFTGYSAVRPLGEGFERAIETFIVARAFDVLEWIHLDWPRVDYHAYGPALLQRSLQTIRHYLR